MSTSMRRNLLVTGGAGFIGANFLCYFVPRHKDIRVINIDSLTYASDLSYLDEIKDEPNYIFEKADINDFAKMKELFARYDIDSVIHFAAESHVDNSISGPLAFVRTNVEGTFNLLENARQAWMDGPNCMKKGKEHTVFYQISTDETYGALGDEGSFTEESPYLPNSPYSASKASADLFVRAYHHTYGLPTLRSNCSNNYGPKQHQEKFIPTIIRTATANQPIPIYGNGKNVRDWLYVEDHCRAIETIFMQAPVGEYYNIGGNQELDNITLARSICALLDEMKPRAEGKYEDLMKFVSDRPGHDFRYAIDPTKLARQLRWQPQEDLKSGMRKTVQWYLQRNEKR